jgi:hypothetical protein
MLEIQRSDVAHLDVDVMQRTVCAEKDCPKAAPLASMQVWRLWMDSSQSWKHYAFCSHEHFLTCIPVGMLGRA